jgi:pSer/pThr/pTyr-binding forkhead associated (FHA) protein
MGDSVKLTLTSPSENFTHHSEGNSVRIGRSTKCEFNVPREDLSREHCLFEVINDEYYVTDLGSKNGITVDRMPIAPNVRTKITNDSVVILSNLYTLKINAFEVKSKMDMMATAAAAAKKAAGPDVQTVSFALDFDKTNSEKKVVLPKKIARRPREVEEVTHNYEVAKMALGFILIVGFVIYHALGR